MRSKDTFLFPMGNKHSNLPWDFSADICYVLLKFHLIVYGNSKHFEFFSIRNSRVFAVAFRHNWCLAYNYCLILRGIPLHAVLFLPPFHISEICIDHLFDFLWLTIGEKYLGMVSIRGLNQGELKVWDKRREKKILKSVGAKTQPRFTPLLIGKDSLK